MSIKIMSKIWEAESIPPTQRFVLICLADHAGKERTCYPSIARISRRTGLSERAVQGAIKALCESGWLRVDRNAGKNGSNLFTILTPAADTPPPPQEMHPAADAPPRSRCAPPPQEMRPTPAADAPKPSRNHQEPSAAAREGVSSSENEPRVQLLAAMGLGPDGVAGPSRFLGTAVDMAEADQWRKAGLPISQQCEVIRDVCKRQKSRNPHWTPARFSYFTPAMRDVVQAATAPVESQKAAQVDKWKRMASG